MAKRNKQVKCVFKGCGKPTFNVKYCDECAFVAKTTRRRKDSKDRYDNRVVKAKEDADIERWGHRQAFLGDYPDEMI